jgi:dipeptidyl aminopeptidase/acylaminoacyl peptidase
VLAALALLAAADASPTRASELAAPALLHGFSGLAASPNGAYLAAVESDEPLDPTKEAEPHLIVRDFSGKNAREIALPCAGSEGCTVSAPTWSPDSKAIAYVVHARKAKERDLFVASVSAATIEPRKLLSFAGTLVSPKFSKSGTSLAVLAVPNARKEVGATQAGAAIVGEIGSAPDEQRIAVVPLDGSPLKYASPPDLFVYEYDWLPNESGFVGTAAPGDGDDNWWVARLFRFDASTAAASELFKPTTAQMQIATPRVSRDGRFVAFVGGIMSDFGSTGGDLYVLDLGTPGATPLDITPNLPASITSLSWLCRDDELLITQLRGDRSEVGIVPARLNEKPYIVASDPLSLSASGANVSAACEEPVESLIRTPHPIFDVRMAAVTQTFETAPEIATAEFGVVGKAHWDAITSANASQKAVARAQSVAWKNDGFDVQGWLLTPVDAPPGKRPMIVSVHGGPAAANVPRFIGRGTTRDLLRHGYDVFLPNPRGSFGQGEAFTLANVKDFGYGDLRDILAGVDAAEKIAPIDETRLGLTGGSYGGFMTMWAVTQTHRFKAAVAGAGISDWVSYYGENGIDEWMIPYFGSSAYDDPAVYRKSSAIDFIKNVTTPTFAYVGERDVECPAPQSQEFWHALHDLNVPTSLVIYEGEGHRIASAAHQADVTKRTLAWFDRYLK